MDGPPDVDGPRPADGDAAAGVPAGDGQEVLFPGYRPPQRPVGTPGRPPLILRGYDPEQRTWSPESPAGMVLAALRIGSHLAPAAAYAGISHTTLRNWLARGREHDPGLGADLDDVDEDQRPYVALGHSVERTVAQAEIQLITRVRAGCQDDPKLALQFLARRFPQNWRESRVVEMSPPAELEQDAVAAALMADPSVAAAAEVVALALGAPAGDDDDGAGAP